MDPSKDISNLESERMSDILDTIGKFLEKTPIPNKTELLKRVQDLKGFIFEGRAPRIMIIGRRGAGKSSLLNAILGEKLAGTGSVLSETGNAKWYSHGSSLGEIEILDTRGLGDSTRPEASKFKSSLEDIKEEIRKCCPDAVLFLCKAKEVDAHIGVDIGQLSEIRDFIRDKHYYEIPVIAVITQVDELDPVRVSEPPYDDQWKKDNIGLAVRTVEKALDAKLPGLVRAFPVSALAEYDDEGKRTYERFWNIDVLSNFLLDVLPKETKMQFARASRIKGAQVRIARNMVRSVSIVCAGIAVEPIPVADMIPITSLQVAMITGIAYLSGRKLDKKGAVDFMTAAGLNLGAAYGLRELARQLVKLIPVAGSVISPAIAYAGTWAIGNAAISYFIKEEKMENIKKDMKTSREEAEKEFSKGIEK